MGIDECSLPLGRPPYAHSQPLHAPGRQPGEVSAAHTSSLHPQCCGGSKRRFPGWLDCFWAITPTEIRLPLEVPNSGGKIAVGAINRRKVDIQPNVPPAAAVDGPMMFRTSSGTMAEISQNSCLCLCANCHTLVPRAPTQFPRRNASHKIEHFWAVATLDCALEVLDYNTQCPQHLMHLPQPIWGNLRRECCST